MRTPEQITEALLAEDQNYDGKYVLAKGVFAKGLRDGVRYLLKKAAPFQGEDTYNFMKGSTVAARFPVSAIKRFLLNGHAGDNNGLVLSEARLKEDQQFDIIYAKLCIDRAQGNVKAAKKYIVLLDKLYGGSKWGKLAMQFGDPQNPATKDEVLHKAHSVLSAASLGLLMSIDKKAGL